MLFRSLSPKRLQGMNGGLFLDETEDAYCVWRTEYDKRRKICIYLMDIFTREGEVWQREQEWHEERAYGPDQIINYLIKENVCRIPQFGNLKMRAPTQLEERISFKAHKEGIK